jgi:deoxyribodipyrimidine photo-lyase
MPPKKAATNGKRKAEPATSTNASSKKVKTSNGADLLREPHPQAQEAEEIGIVLRKYYPHEISNA